MSFLYICEFCLNPQPVVKKGKTYLTFWSVIILKPQQTFTCSDSAIETLEIAVK